MVEWSSLNFSIQNFYHGCYYLYTYVTSLAKTHHVYTTVTTEFNFITPAYKYNQWLLIPSISIKCYISTGLLLWRLFCQPFKVMTGTMVPMEGANWGFPLPLWPIVFYYT